MNCCDLRSRKTNSQTRSAISFCILAPCVGSFNLPTIELNSIKEVSSLLFLDWLEASDNFLDGKLVRDCFTSSIACE